MPDEKIKITDDFLVSHGNRVYDDSRDSRTLLTEQMKKDMDQYDGIFSSEERKWSEFLGAPRLFINKTYTNTQRILVDVIETFFNDPEEVVGISSWKSIPMESREIFKADMNYRLNGHPIDFYQELYEGGMDALKIGVCVYKIFPKLKIGEKKDTERTAGEVQQTDNAEEDNNIEAYEPQWNCVPPEDLFVSPRATWKDYWQHSLIHRYKRTRDDLKRMGYKNVDAVSSVLDQTAGADEVKIQRYDQYQSPFNRETGVKQAEEVWVYEVWDYLPGSDGFLESGSYILLGDDQRPTVVGRGWVKNRLPYNFSEFEHNRPPFILGFAYPESHRFKGRSYPEITKSLQQETNAQRNQEREAVARFLRPTMYLNRDANVDLMSVVNRRIGGFVQGDGPPGQSMGELPMQNPLAATIGAQARTDNDYSENGLPPNLLGSSSQEDTATASTQQLQNANKKIAFVVKNIAYTAILPGLRFLGRLEQTYATDEHIRQVTGRVLGWRFSDDNFPPRDAIQGDFEFKVNLGLNKQSQINKWLLIGDRMTQANLAIGQLVQLGVIPANQVRFKDPNVVFEKILRILGEKNMEDFEIQAVQPPPQQGPQRGIASQPGNVLNPDSQFNQLNPSQEDGLLNVIQ